MGCDAEILEVIVSDIKIDGKEEAKFETFEKLRLLGKGNYGEIFLVKSQFNKRLYALKQIPLKGISDINLNLIKNEADNLKELDHPNITFHKSIFISNNVLNIISEYAEKGDLNNELVKYKNQNKYFEENKLLNWLMQATLVLQYIHENGVVHSDIKPSNIFLTKDNSIKLGDFGIFKRILNYDEEKLYIAPELIEKNEYTNKVDIWSLGVTFCHLMTLEFPFEGNNKEEIYENILKVNKNPKILNEEKNNYNNEITKKYSKEFLDLIDIMMSLDPKKRPSSHQILRNNIIRKRMNDYLKENKFDNQNYKEAAKSIKKYEENIDTNDKRKKRLKMKESVYLLDENEDKKDDLPKEKIDKRKYDLLRQMSNIFDQACMKDNQ